MKYTQKLISACMALSLSGVTSAGVIDFNPAIAFLDNDGTNTVGFDDGENYTIFVNRVSPAFGGILTAT